MSDHSLQLHATAADDSAFLALVAGLTTRALEGSRTRRLHLIHMDNWFDHKWLRFAGAIAFGLGDWRQGEQLAIPAFNPKRVLHEQAFARAGCHDQFAAAEPAAPIHVETGDQIGRSPLNRRVSQIAPEAALVWYSGNTRSNRQGAVMAYLPTSNGHDTWYASFRTDPKWSIHKAKGILRSAIDPLPNLEPGA